LTVMMVAKDLGAAAVLVPLGIKLIESGERVYGVAEGLAIEAFKRAELLTHELQGPCTPQDAATLLRHTSPRVVVTGLSSPINAEESIGCAANDAGIPLVVVEDFWGAVARTRARPDLVGTLDSIGVAHAHKHCPWAELFITGNPGAKKVAPSSEVLAEVQRLRSRYDRIYLFTESGPEAATEQLDLLVRSLQMTAGNWCLVPCFHPKWVNHLAPGGSTYGELWRKSLAPIARRVEDVPGNRDELVCVVDVTVSVFSTLLTVAAYNGKAAVSLDTPRSREYLAQESGGLTEAPQVGLGLATKVAVPADLSAVAARSGFIQPYDPMPLAIALKAI